MRNRIVRRSFVQRRTTPQRLLAMVAGIAAVLLGILAGTPATASAGTLDKYTIDTGWVSDWDGGCRAKAHVDYYPGSDTAYFETTVQNPYLFVACRANTQVWVQTAANVYPGAVHYAMACAIPDPTCASTQTWTGSHSGQTSGLTAYVDSVNDALEAAGLPRSYTRKQAMTGIRVTFSKA